MGPMLRHRIVKTRWGYCGYVVGDRGLVATFLPQPSRSAVQRLISQRHGESREDPKLLPGLAAALCAYFQGRAIRFQDGTLFVAVDDAGWRQMMAIDSEKILKIIHACPHGRVIKELRLVWGEKGN